jgi:hypothetical protein
MTLTPTTKRILYALVFLAAIVAIGYILYVVFFAPSQGGNNQNQNQNVNGGIGGLPNINDILNNINSSNTNGAAGIPGIDTVANGGLTETEVLTPQTDTQQPSQGADGSLRYYDATDGKFYKVDGNGKITQMGDAQFRGVENVTWADASNETILEFPDGSNVYYNLDTKKQVTLPKEFEAFDFSPNSSQIAFKYMNIDPERRVLAVSNPDGSSARTLESLGDHADRVTVNWSPTGKIAASYAEFIDLNRQEVGFVGLKGENFKGTIVEGRGLQSQYSEDGKNLLYSVYSSSTDYKPSLWIVGADGDAIGSNRKELQLNTFAEKCAFTADSTTVYCGVPSDQKYGYGLEPDILNGVSDDIYKINLVTGTKTKVATPVGKNGQAIYSVDSMMVSTDGSQIYFRDKTTGQLVKMQVK